jgi:hypothetical protein
VEQELHRHSGLLLPPQFLGRVSQGFEVPWTVKPDGALFHPKALSACSADLVTANAAERAALCDGRCVQQQQQQQQHRALGVQLCRALGGQAARVRIRGGGRTVRKKPCMPYHRLWGFRVLQLLKPSQHECMARANMCTAHGALAPSPALPCVQTSNPPI